MKTKVFFGLQFEPDEGESFKYLLCDHNGAWLYYIPQFDTWSISDCGGYDTVILGYEGEVILLDWLKERQRVRERKIKPPDSARRTKKS